MKKFLVGLLILLVISPNVICAYWYADLDETIINDTPYTRAWSETGTFPGHTVALSVELYLDTSPSTFLGAAYGEQLDWVYVSTGIYPYEKMYCYYDATRFIF